jgi:serine phosphatase RsbU (regulator of sigma subunit)
MLGAERCLKVVSDHRHRPAEKILDELLHEMHTFVQQESQQDDVTIVIAKLR